MKLTNPRQWLPSKVNFVILFTVWLLLTNSYSLGNLLLATFLSLLIAYFTSSIQMPTTRVARPLKALRYIAVLIGDIISSNFIVAKQVLGPIKNMKPGFVIVPLDICEPLPITLLANTISLTPGTVSAEVSQDKSKIYIHALHVENEADLIATIKKRYEQPLREIFEC